MGKEKRNVMEKAESVLKYYVLCHKLKDVIRTGWKDWHVKRERLESVAEHVYGVQMLALAMWSEYSYDLDIQKVIFMLAIHELGESVIGDITLFDMDHKEKEEKEHQAVKAILKDLLQGERIEELFEEFDAHQTKESLFAYQCDKLEADLQCWLYDLENCVDLNDQEGNISYQDKDVQKLLQEGKSWSEMWMRFSLDRYPYDENFREVSEYAMKHKI